MMLNNKGKRVKQSAMMISSEARNQKVHSHDGQRGRFHDTFPLVRGRHFLCRMKRNSTTAMTGVLELAVRVYLYDVTHITFDKSE